MVAACTAGKGLIIIPIIVYDTLGHCNYDFSFPPGNFDEDELSITIIHYYEIIKKSKI